MLVITNFDTQIVYTFKLTTGEEIIAKVSESHEHTLVINKPLVVVNSGQGAGIMQYINSANMDKSMVLHRHGILLHAETESAVARQYMKITTGFDVDVNKEIIV